jgi:type IV pilus assembly protein PilM
MSLYNFASLELLPHMRQVQEYDSSRQPESVAILDIGGEASNFVVTNGYRVWQRSIPLGGSHFTRILTKDFKLTYRKAEELKRNAASAADPKAVFQAMRPVFQDLVTEVQRSLGYFMNLDREARVSHIVALGGGMKLPGLARYLGEKLQLEVKQPAAWNSLDADTGIAPLLEQQRAGFSVCYGLAHQGLGRAPLRSNLLPLDMQRGAAARLKTLLSKASRFTRRMLSHR